VAIISDGAVGFGNAEKRDLQQSVRLSAIQRSVAAPANVGFSCGYYPFAPYLWTDPYGFQYTQLPAAAGR
jgi:hypothetical protein